MSSDRLNEQTKKAQLKRLEKSFRQHDKMLIGWLTQKLSDPEIARDIAQDAYLRVWRFAHKVEIENTQALLFKTAANLAANEFRARQRFRATHSETGQDPDNNTLENLASEAPSPEQATCARSDVEISLSAIRALPEKTRRAFIMSRFEEMSYREISKSMNVSVSSVEKYIISALTALRNATHKKNDTSKKVIPFRIKK